jgi:hypothetical protein
MVGEAEHQKGADGMRRAKRWLDSTTRVRASWTNEDQVNASKLEFPWPFGGQKFSFDVGGILLGEEFDGHFFVAECKKYKDDSDQGKHYDDHLAKCYVTRRDFPRSADEFLWITWAPFRVTTWPQLCSADAVKKGLLVERNRKRVFDTETKDEAEAAIDMDVVKDVSDRLWVVVLSDKQERLVISNEDRALVMKARVEAESG